VVDNTNVCHCVSVHTPALAVHTKLAVKMGWLRKVDSGWILGPNLQQEFMGDQIPNMKTQGDWKEISDKDGNPVFWTTTRVEVYLELSMSCGCSVSFGGGRTHAISTRVLGRGRQQHCGKSRDRFVARSQVQEERTRDHLL